MNTRSRDERNSIDRFVRRQNIEHYVHLLEIVTDEAERRTLLRLLDEERRKQTEAGVIDRDLPPAAGTAFRL